MPIFEVMLKEIEIYLFSEIEAKNEEEAEEKAWSLLTEETRPQYHYDSDGESEIYEQD